MTSLARPAARAFLVAAIAALVADALLALVTGLTSVVHPGDGPPWWVAAHLVERGRWVMLALLFEGAARRWPQDAPPQNPQHLQNPPSTWRLVGIAVMAVPLLWIAATWLTQAVLFTAAGRWSIDGEIFLSPGYYRQLFAGYVPWLLGGATAMAIGRHVN